MAHSDREQLWGHEILGVEVAAATFASAVLVARRPVGPGLARGVVAGLVTAGAFTLLGAAVPTVRSGAGVDRVGPEVGAQHEQTWRSRLSSLGLAPVALHALAASTLWLYRVPLAIVLVSARRRPGVRRGRVLAALATVVAIDTANGLAVERMRAPGHP